MAKKMVPWCIDSHGSAQSEILFAISEPVFNLAHSYLLLLSAQFLLGQQDIWLDTLPRFTQLSVEWRRLP